MTSLIAAIGLIAPSGLPPGGVHRQPGTRRRLLELIEPGVGFGRHQAITGRADLARANRQRRMVRSISRRTSAIRAHPGRT